MNTGRSQRKIQICRVLTILMALHGTGRADSQEDLTSVQTFECFALLQAQADSDIKVSIKKFNGPDEELPAELAGRLTESSRVLLRRIVRLPDASLLTWKGSSVTEVLSGAVREVPIAWASDIRQSQREAARNGNDFERLENFHHQHVVRGIYAPALVCLAGICTNFSALLHSEVGPMIRTTAAGTTIALGGWIYMVVRQVVNPMRIEPRVETPLQPVAPLAKSYQGRNFATYLLHYLEQQPGFFEASFPLDSMEDGPDTIPEAAIILGRNRQGPYLIFASSRFN